MISSLPRNINADTVVPHVRKTRATVQGEIRFGDTYRGESELTKSGEVLLTNASRYKNLKKKSLY